MAERSGRGFGSTVLAGLLGSGGAAVAGNQPWADTDDRTGGAAVNALGNAIAEASAPLVAALALVALASWGVVLVARGRFRRVVAALCLVASALLLVAAVAAWTAAPSVVHDALVDRGVADPQVGRTAWSYLGLVAAMIAVGAAATAVRRVSAWPEMGRRYDAPGAAAGGPAGAAARAADVPVEERSNAEVWRSLDEGQDPTAPDAPDESAEGDQDRGPAH